MCLIKIYILEALFNQFVAKVKARKTEREREKKIVLGTLN